MPAITRSTVPAVEAVGEEAGGGRLSRRIVAWTTEALRDLVYAAAVFLWSIVAFTVLVTGVSVTVSLIVFIVGVFVCRLPEQVMRRSAPLKQPQA
ncbi:MAG: hypothetical protein ACM33U_07460 [Solirubrobacterales bacterium]